MNSEKFKMAFEEIQKRIELPEYLKVICTQLSTEKPIIEVHEILNMYGINASIAKVDFLHLIFEYIKLSLEDDLLTNEERDHIKYLKRLFQIQPGDFQLHNSFQVERVITIQLSKIYEDDFVTPEEALLKVDLQELFDLSFDEMNEYSKKEAIVSMQKGAAAENLDVFCTHSEYFKLKV
jgi:hypothetical protein